MTKLFLILGFFIASSAFGQSITCFQASSTSVSAGTSVLLGWIDTGTVTTLNQGIGTVSSPTGWAWVTPLVTTTYVLTAGAAIASVTITVTGSVGPSPPTGLTATVN